MYLVSRLHIISVELSSHFHLLRKGIYNNQARWRWKFLFRGYRSLQVEQQCLRDKENESAFDQDITEVFSSSSLSI